VWPLLTAPYKNTYLLTYLVDDSGTVEDVLQHRVTSECLSIFNENGTFRKSKKSKTSANTCHECHTRAWGVYIHYRHGPHLAAVNTKHGRQREDTGTKYTWGDYAQKMMNLVLRRHGNADRIICVNDSYDQNYSIKDSERILRQKQLPIRNVFMKAEDKFPSSRDFHPLLSKSENKIHLQAFLQNAFLRTATTTDTAKHRGQ